MRWASIDLKIFPPDAAIGKQQEPNENLNDFLSRGIGNLLSDG